MDDLHLTPELMAAFVRNELPPAVFANLVFKHLLAVCPTCSAALRTTFRTPEGEYHFKDAIAAAERALVGRQQALLHEEAHQARRDLSELMRTAPDARLGRVRNATSRFRSPFLVELLIDRSREVIRDSPAEAVELAALARAVAERVTLEDIGWECRIRAAAHQGNASRVCGDFAAAEACFAEARRLLEREMVPDTLVHAELARLEGSLRIDQRRFADALTLLSRAALLYRLTRETRNLAITLMKLAHLHYLCDEPLAAIEVNLEALRGLDSEKEPQLYAWALHNLANLLCHSEQFNEARRTLTQAKRGGEGKTTIARRLWLEGRIAKGLLEKERAESFFEDAIRAFKDLSLPLHVGICTIDLAELYLEEGRARDVLSLAESLDPLLGTPDLHGEASKALLFFQNAALQQFLSVQIIREVRARLERVQTSQGRLPGVC